MRKWGVLGAFCACAVKGTADKSQQVRISAFIQKQEQTLSPSGRAKRLGEILEAAECGAGLPAPREEGFSTWHGSLPLSLWLVGKEHRVNAQIRQTRQRVAAKWPPVKRAGRVLGADRHVEINASAERSQTHRPGLVMPLNHNWGGDSKVSFSLG